MTEVFNSIVKDLDYKSDSTKTIKQIMMKTQCSGDNALVAVIKSSSFNVISVNLNSSRRLKSHVKHPTALCTYNSFCLLIQDGISPIC